MTRERKKPWFPEFARVTSVWAGSAPAFGLAVATIVVWIVTGPVFHYSDTWQLVINTGTTIITFLMVFLIQNSQNRDSKLIQLKLDELIRAIEGAETALIRMDEMDETELEAVRDKYAELAQRAADRKGKRLKDAPAPVLVEAAEKARAALNGEGRKS